MSLERQPWSDSLESVVHGKGFYDQFDCDYWKNKYRWCFGGDGGGGGSDGGDESEATSQESQDEQSANEASAAADAAATAEAAAMAPGFMGWGLTGLPGPTETEDSFGFIGVPDPETGLVDPAGFATDQRGNTVAPGSPEVDGFLSAALNSLTDPVGILSLALGIPGIVSFGVSKGLDALGVDVPSLANMAGVTANNTGIADLGLNAAQDALDSVTAGITDTPASGITDTPASGITDTSASGIAGLGISDPAQAVGTGIPSFSDEAPMGLSSLGVGTSLGVADTTNLNDVTPSWSPTNFQRYSGVGGFTPQAGIGALAANSNLYKNYMENT